ncbi:CO4 protein, partial [Crotophaga sulcirostris]|nr:CO4 protein [Crotophaga sulcirostris]
FLITAPNVVHLGIEETITVQVHGAQHPVQVTAYFKDETKNQLLSERIIFNLHENNNYQEMKKVMYLILWVFFFCTLQVKPGILRQDLFKKSNQLYVLLVTESRDLFKETIQSTRILLSSKKGYIFIQTDKPIYTPSSKVRYRIFILDNTMRPADDTVTGAVLNSKGMMVKKADRKIKSAFSGNFEIPDVAEPGTWKIKAWFYQHEMSNVSAEFEVKPYELPSFEVKLIPLQPYYHIWNENFVFDIEAKHTYGKGIQGAAYVRFGIIDENENKVFIPGLEQQLSLQNGNGRVTLNTTLLEEKLRKSISTLEGFHLYVAVTTVETASGEMREEELTDVKFVKSPYVVDLSNTKKYFVPGAPFSVVASVTLVDGSPAASLPVTTTVTLPGKTPMKKTALSNKEGLIPFTFNIPQDAQILHITAEEGKERLESPETSIRAERYQSASANYLSISIPHTVVAPGDNLHITLNTIHQPGSGKTDYCYYMVVARGQVELLGRVPSSHMIINLKITEKMVPAFRFLAYYFITNEGHREIVADSVWVDVMDVCEGKIKVRTERDKYQPTDSINLLIETDHAGTVALAVVDKAVFILNKKNKLTAKKVFKAMNSYDLGCSAGGGANSDQVFTDVGLAFISDTIKSNARKDYKCLQATQRQKRSFDFQKEMSGIGINYQDTDLQKCCQDGMKPNPMRFSCAARLRKVVGSSECRKAFQDCCEKATAIRKQRTRTSEQKSHSCFAAYDEDEEDFDEVNLRSYFPESWWWNFEEVKSPGKQRVQNFVPDSITTWEIQAISISPQKGFCIADPYTFTVFKDVFVSLRLPYSVRRNEQLEIKAVVYNYQPNDLQVLTVTMDVVKGLCTAGTMEKPVQQMLVAKGNSATPAYFSVVPLTVGEIPITITAFNRDFGYGDSVRKNLNVVAEGILQREEKTFCINSDARSHTLDLKKPSDMVPDSDSHVFVSLKGNIMDESVENCLSLTGVEKLIQVPTGCAEQTMVKMAPTVYAIEYLDASEQWVNFDPERKEEAVDMIEKGYTRLLEFQKEDGSYGAFKRTPSSVWLTAFIVKVLTRCQEYISVQNSHIQNSISYLLSQQQADDSFHDHHPVLDRTMQGGIGSAEEDLALTAFVTIALQQSLQVYESSDVVQVVRRAVAYMNNQLSRNTNCYSTAITAYALTLVQSNSDEVQLAKKKLRDCSVFDPAKNHRYWGNGKDAISVETTAYALLQTLLLQDMEYATPIATWLTERRNYGGGYCSTQDTVVALEALSAYSIQTLNTASTNLTVKLATPGRQKDYIFVLTDAHETIQKQLEFDLGRKLEVSVNGRGNGTMSILKVYWSSELKNNTCNDLILTVEMEGNIKYSEAAHSYENYDYEEAAAENSEFQPRSKREWRDIRSRRRRDVNSPSKAESLQYKICVRSVGSNAPKMSLVDLSLLSGLEPDTRDLDQLVTSSDQYIQHYEYKEGKVLLYFGELTSGPEPDCISFGAKQINPMGLVQPANAILYDFYNPDRKCSVFYSAPKHSTMLSKVCNADVCQCAEGPCPKQRSTFSKAIKESTRSNFACYDPVADYVYEVELLNSTQKNVFDYYEAKIHTILKTTNDESIQVGAHRQFLKRSTCNLDMVIGKRYLLMGKDGQTVDCNNKMQYFLDAKTWVEKIPEDNECRTTLRRPACAHLQDFVN